MDAVDAIFGRRAIRNFTSQVPPRAEIEALIEAAVQAPNGMNRQPWAFVVVEDKAALARFSIAAKAHLMQTMAQGSPLHAHRGQLVSDDFNIFYNAPVLVVICATDPDPMSAKDCCLAAENLMLAAHDRRLGTCWIGFAEAWLNSSEGKQALAVPEGHTVVAPIILGHPAETPARPHRNTPAVRWVATPAPVAA
ncbi:MAG TPA: nitroreductase family protein [Caulobacteraceae bacterium]|nr:nitroreductase family protein [Caulobacteraceae bacterium]